MKKIAIGKDARLKLLEGVKLMYDCVVTTLGPKGRNVALSRPWGYPLVIHDGVTVAKEVESEDELVQMGVLLIREAANNTNTEAGDGTTTATLFAYHLVEKGMKLLDEGVNPMFLRKQIEAAMPKLKEEINKIAVKTDKMSDVERVAYISSSDELVGKLVAEAIEKVGKDGLVTVEEGKTIDTTIDYTEGMEFDRGYRWAGFITNPDRQEAVLINPVVIIFNKELSMQIEVLPLLDTFLKQGIKTFFFVGKIKGPAMDIIATNKRSGNFNALVVDPPGFGDNQKAILEDLAIMTGGKVIPDEFFGMPQEEFVKNFDKDWIGYAKTVITNERTTKVIKTDDKDIQTAVKERVRTLKKQKENSDSPFTVEQLDERIAKLTTGAAVIKVGVKNEVEMREKVERVKDAVGAAKAALEEGVVPGGGVTFMRIAEEVFRKTDLNDGERLLRDVLYEPVVKLLSNAGESEDKTATILSELAAQGGHVGYEVRSGEVKDMTKAGVLDPARVIRLSLENGVAVANTILTTDVLIADKHEPLPNQ
jgi:chaperonin GroEL